MAGLLNKTTTCLRENNMHFTRPVWRCDKQFCSDYLLKIGSRIDISVSFWNCCPHFHNISQILSFPLTDTTHLIISVDSSNTHFGWPMNIIRYLNTLGLNNHRLIVIFSHFTFLWKKEVVYGGKRGNCSRKSEIRHNSSATCVNMILSYYDDFRKLCGMLIPGG